MDLFGNSCQTVVTLWKWLSCELVLILFVVLWTCVRLHLSSFSMLCALSLGFCVAVSVDSFGTCGSSWKGLANTCNWIWRILQMVHWRCIGSILDDAAWSTLLSYQWVVFDTSASISVWPLAKPLGEQCTADNKGSCRRTELPSYCLEPTKV